MMRKMLFAAAGLLCACRSQAEAPAVALPSGAPKLLVVISVDQFSADLFDEYRPQFSHGLARLATGTVFHNGYQSHAATETCPGHSTILTGNHPAHTGIIGNTWIDQSIARADKVVYCAEDETVPGTTSLAYKVSPNHLLVPTLGEVMKARWPGSRNVAVSGKDRAAVMMTGHRADQRWFWTGTKFDTDLAGARVPLSAMKVNAAVAAALAQPRPPLEAAAFCQSKARPIALERSTKIVGNGQFARAAGDSVALKTSPELDGDTLALAAALVDEMQLGRRAAPDVLAISLSATDYVGHAYGTEGEEMCLQLLELDREIGDFLAVLDSRHIEYPRAPAPRGNAAGCAQPPGHGHQGDGREAGAAAGADGPRPARQLELRRRLCRQEPRAEGPGAADRGRRGGLSRAAAGAGSAHREGDRRDADADGVAGELDSHPARAGELLSGTVGRLPPRPEAGDHPDSGAGRPLCRDAWQPLGLRPAGPDPVLATRYGGDESRDRGRHDRHHADARRDDRTAGRLRLDRRPLPLASCVLRSFRALRARARSALSN